MLQFQAKIEIWAEFLLKDIRGFVGSAIVFDERVADSCRTGANQFDLALQKKTQAVDCVYIKRITHRHDQSGFTKGHRNDFETTRVFGANLLDHRGRNDHHGNVDPIHMRLTGERARHIRLRNDAVLNQKIDNVALAVQA